jgi:hypothetical protein
MLSQRWNSFRVCSVCDEIRSAYAQHGFLCKNCTHFTAGWACTKIRSSYPQCAINHFLVCSVCDKIVSAYAQHAHAKFRKVLKKSQIKMQISTIKNRNFEKPFRNPSNRTKVNFLKNKIFWISLQTNLVPRMLSHRENVRTSKFWRKSKEKKRFFSKIYQEHIKIWFR